MGSDRAPTIKVAVEIADDKVFVFVEAPGVVEANDDPGRGFKAHGVVGPDTEDPGIEIADIGGGTY